MKTDRLPPYAEEAERNIIGCCLISPATCLSDAQAVITGPEFFYDLRCQTIWAMLCNMEVRQINFISVLQRLKDSGKLPDAGGMEFLDKCTDVITTGNLPVWLEDAQAKHVVRKLIAACTDLVEAAYSHAGDYGGLLDAAESKMLAIRPGQRNESSIRALVTEALSKIEDKCVRMDAISGIETGLADLDRQSDGMHAGEMIVVCGFPSTGKTALAVNIAMRCALNKIPAAIFSAEMRPVQLVVRSLCSEARVNFHKASFDDVPKFNMPSINLTNAEIHVEQAAGMSIGQVRAIARRLKQKHNIKIIVVDYIQLLTGIGDNREQEISSISKGCKAMALELDVAVLALSQLTDDGKMRESRSIAQDADTIWKLINDGDWQPAAQPINLTIEKCRDGATGLVKLMFMKEYTRFENVAKVSREDEPERNYGK